MSKYKKLFLELIKSENNFEISLKEFREKLEIPQSYKNFDIKRKVIKNLVEKEILKNLNIKIDKKIVKISCDLKDKKEKIIEKTQNLLAKEMILSFTDLVNSYRREFGNIFFIKRVLKENFGVFTLTKEHKKFICNIKIKQEAKFCLVYKFLLENEIILSAFAYLLLQKISNKREFLEAFYNQSNKIIKNNFQKDEIKILALNILGVCFKNREIYFDIFAVDDKKADEILKKVQILKQIL